MSNTIADWTTGKVYIVDEVVIVTTEAAQFNNRMYRCLVGHTSFSWATDYGNSLWEDVKTQGIAGPQGDAGAVGAQGPAGVNGANGPSGGDGADGLITAIANQSEAETGVENTKAMTALRTKQAIDAQMLADRAAIVANTAETAVAGGNATLSNRITTLETATGTARVNGKQSALNSAAATDITGSASGAGGAGNELELSSAGAKSARIHMEIYRKDDAEVRFTTCVLLAHLIPVLNTWVLERESTTSMVGDPDGITFDVTTTEPLAGIFVGQLNYASDNMVGGNYDSDSYVKYTVYEISDTF